MSECLNVIDSIDVSNLDWNNLNGEAVTIDELTGEVIEINYDVLSENKG